MHPLCIMLSPSVVTLAPFYDSSPEESLSVPVELLAIECTSIKVLVGVEVVVSIVKLNCPQPGHSKVVVGGVVTGSSASVHPQLPGSYRRVGHCRDSGVSCSPCQWC